MIMIVDDIVPNNAARSVSVIVNTRMKSTATYTPSQKNRYSFYNQKPYNLHAKCIYVFRIILAYKLRFVSP